jgi:peptide/nickel transport system permease protein
MSAVIDHGVPARPSALKRALGKARSNPTTMVGMAICIAILFAAVFAPWLSPHNPAEQDLLSRLQPPGGDFPLGTDQFGRDILGRAHLA